MAIKNRLNDKLSLAEVNKLFYATASAVSDILGNNSGGNNNNYPKNPETGRPWGMMA